MDKEWIVEGRVWKVGNNVNTESITPSKWLHEGHEAIMEHIGELLIAEFPKKVEKGDIWVSGSNLGCSSSRNAPLFLKEKGIGAVLCKSASRIFYRNAVNSGLPIFDIGEDGEEFRAKAFPGFIMDILGAGGIGPYILSRKKEYKLLK